MKFKIPSASRIAAITLVLLASCSSKTGSFTEDVLCASCVESACDAHDDFFADHVRNAAPPDQAQLIAQMETHKGCMAEYPDLADIADRMYSGYGAAFYAVDQPWIKERGLRAFDEVLKKKKHSADALRYLSFHADAWKEADWAEEKMAALVDHAADSDEIFALAVQTAPDERLASLAAMESTPSRDSALIYHWPRLPADARRRALSAWIAAAWTLQTSGSALLPQYLTLDVQKYPLPKDVPDFAATVSVKEIRVGRTLIKRGKWFSQDTFAWPAITSPGTRHGRLNLQPWLSAADTVRVHALAVLKIWPQNADESCLNSQESCSEMPLAEQNIEFDRSYRIFAGVETGAPRRHKVDRDNAETSKLIQFELCSSGACRIVWNGKQVKSQNEPLKVMQGNDFYLKSAFNGAQQAVAVRLMARPGVGSVWQEIATLYSFEPQFFDIPARGNIDLASLCGKTGLCRLEMQIRPSLRMARRDPRIDRYWGAVLDLGMIDLDIQNQTVQQLWSH